jgi:hypothetical protein
VRTAATDTDIDLHGTLYLKIFILSLVRFTKASVRTTARGQFNLSDCIDLQKEIKKEKKKKTTKTDKHQSRGALGTDWTDRENELEIPFIQNLFLPNLPPPRCQRKPPRFP